MHEDLRYRAIFENAIDAFIIISQKGVIEIINPAACILFKYEEKELIGENVSKLMPTPHSTNHDKYISNYLTTGERKIMGIGRQVFGLKNDGSIFPIRLAVSEIKIDGISSFLGIIHDQTQIVNASEKIKLKNESLEKIILEKTKDLLHLLEKEKELNDIKSKFVSLVSHEFRTPLSTILSSISIINKYAEPYDNYEKIKKHIDKVKRSIKNLNGILSDLLTLSTFDEKKVVEESEWFDLHELFAEVESSCQFMLSSKQCVTTKIKPGNFHLYTQRNFLKNIIFNLVTNAIKFLGNGSKIECSAKIIKDKIEISVKDEGIGIPLEAQEKLFNRFYRAQNVQNIEGTGLGLNIVKKYLELINGKIKFISDEKGTTFFITLLHKNQEA